VRMRAHCEGAGRIATWLATDPRVDRVYYPGLPGHTGHDVAARQMSDYGGMVSFTVGSASEAVRVASATRLFLLAESLGGVESLIEVPQAMTHQSVEDSAAAVPADLVRLSCGVEAPEDLVEDLKQALSG
jgi:cystathionine gamma-synthase